MVLVDVPAQLDGHRADMVAVNPVFHSVVFIVLAVAYGQDDFPECLQVGGFLLCHHHARFRRVACSSELCDMFYTHCHEERFLRVRTEVEVFLMIQCSRRIMPVATALAQELFFAIATVQQLAIAEVSINLQPPFGIGHRPEPIGAHVNLRNGFGVVANEDGTGASIVIVTDGSAKSESSDLLDKYFKKLLFFICTNRESLGLAPAVAPKGYRKEEQADRRTSGSPKKRSKPGRSSQPDDDGDVVQGQVFELGTRVVYLSAGKGLNGDYHSGRDIRPHAVAGYTQVRNGKTIKVRPHWNHGSGIKRNELPREIVERNIKLN